MKARKVLIAGLLLVLVVGATILGTIAFLQDQTAAVTNTFTVGSLFAPTGNIVLNESRAVAGTDAGVYTLDPDTKVMQNAYTIVPGVNVPKDPEVTVTKLGVNAYLFIEVVDATPDTITWTIDSAWTLLSGVTGPNGGAVYYIDSELTPTGTDAGQSYGVITGDIVNVAGTHAANAEDTNIVFYAYLCQSGGFADQAAAWDACFA